MRRASKGEARGRRSRIWGIARAGEREYDKDTICSGMLRRLPRHPQGASTFWGRRGLRGVRVQATSTAYPAALSPASVSYYDSVMTRRMQGEEISESQVDEWVSEAEAGYDVEELRRRSGGRPARASAASQVVPVRLTADELAAVMERAEREHLNRSEAIRAALAAWAHAA